jgi:arylformamidase
VNVTPKGRNSRSAGSRWSRTQGLYVDSPFHRYAHGKDLSELALESLANLDCVVVCATGRRARAIDRLPIELPTLRGKALLVHTGWDAHWRTDQYFEGHPYLTGELAQQLVEAGVTLVGIDSFNIDCTDDGNRPVHSALLGAEIPIVEHLRGLSALPDRGARFYAVPVKVKGMGTFPVRAFARV